MCDRVALYGLRARARTFSSIGPRFGSDSIWAIEREPQHTHCLRGFTRLSADRRWREDGSQNGELFLRGPLGTIDRADVRQEWRRFVFVTLAFLVVSAFAVLDIAADLGEGTPFEHVIIEGVIAILGAVGTCFGVSRILLLRKQTQELSRAKSELSERLKGSCEEAERWREKARELLQGLGELIDQQFEQWRLTRAERSVALLILKGLSHKELAALRQVGEATVRQQAASIYKKANVSGRHELSAFFLEDLLAPRDVNDDHNQRQEPG